MLRSDRVTINWFGVFVYGVCFGLAWAAGKWPQYQWTFLTGIGMFELGLIASLVAIFSKKP